MNFVLKFQNSNDEDGKNIGDLGVSANIDQSKDLNPIPVCKCGCTCGAAKKMQTMREEEKTRPQGNNKIDGTTSSASSDAALAATMDGIGSPILGLTHAQHQRLLALLGSHMGSPGNPSTNVAAANFSGKMEDDWVIDTWATNHITYNIDSLFDAINWPDIPPVQIPNGETTTVHALGRIALGKRLTLERVLGDLPSRMLIGVGRERNGLYYLEPMKGGQALLASNSVKANIGNVHQINLDQTNTLVMFNNPDLEPSALPTRAPQSNSPTAVVSHTTEPMSPTMEHKSSIVQHSSLPSASNVLESIGSDLSTVKTPPLDPIDSSVINEIGNIVPIASIVSGKRQWQISRSLSGYDYTLPPSLAAPTITQPPASCLLP
ncbi:hypothetical protein Patl1_26328 [Pistacia atlantica]|uniref:Uncharacterized protein n=1 Tax=Pistacia atlantica TaxID=434234 RepID=A0ACC1B0Z6_9ROSI|nr:hypothetical protein Patl1_26328 [Pistacia atlantica]